MCRKEIKIKEILNKLKSLSNPKAIEGMAKFGITPKKAYGVSIPTLRKMAKEIGKNHKLASQLWDIDTRETRILASMIDEPDLVTEEQMERWVRDFDCWEVCDQVCQNLFAHTKFAYKKLLSGAREKKNLLKEQGLL